MASRNSSPKLERTSVPGVYKRGSRYVAITYHKGKQVKTFHRTLKEAKEAKADRSRGNPVAARPQSKLLLADYARAWVKDSQGRTRRGLDPDTRESYATALESYAIPFFGDARLVEIDAPTVKAFVRSLQDRGLANTTVSRYYAPVRALFSEAAEDGTISSNPAASVRVAGRQENGEDGPRRVKALSRAELAALLAEIPERYRLLFRLLVVTGLRISEAIALQWQDIEFGEQPRVHVRRQFYRGRAKDHPKTVRGFRQVPLEPGLAAELWTIGAERPETELLFSTRTGRPFSDRNLRRTLDGASERAGLDWRPGHHAFRHTFATYALLSGKPVVQVAGWLGHDPGVTMQTYAHVLCGELGDVDFMGNDRAMEGPQTSGSPEVPDPA